MSKLTCRCIMGLPRSTNAFSLWHAQQTLATLGLRLGINQGAFWGQCMQDDFEHALDHDFILALDSDSLFTELHLQRMFGLMASNEQWDALAALQPKRGKTSPLAWHPEKDKEGGSVPFQVRTAHFGLTIIRTSRLKDVQLPWFAAVPNEDGKWGDGKLNDDTYFWEKWYQHGRNVWIDPQCSIGHVEETVGIFVNGEHKRLTVNEWLEHAYQAGADHRSLGHPQQRKAG